MNGLTKALVAEFIGAFALSKRRMTEMFARITSGGLTHRRALLLLFGLASCTGSPATLTVQPDFKDVPARVEVSGSAGIPDADLKRLIEEGIRQGCNRQDIAPTARESACNLLTVWHFERLAPRPLLMVTATLVRHKHQIGSAFSQILSPTAQPDAAFEYSISELACSLYRNAGLVAAADRGREQATSKPVGQS
jgi:hypothetical protein